MVAGHERRSACRRGQQEGNRATRRDSSYETHFQESSSAVILAKAGIQ